MISNISDICLFEKIFYWYGFFDWVDILGKFALELDIVRERDWYGFDTGSGLGRDPDPELFKNLDSTFRIYWIYSLLKAQK